MNLQLTHTKVNSCTFKGGGMTSDMPVSGNINMQYKALYADDQSDKFAVEFHVLLPSPDKKEENIIELTFTGYFILGDDITQEFKDSFFPTVNAPAIVFPYLRAFLATLLLNAGYSPIHIPSINFQAVAKKMKEDGVKPGLLN